MSTRQGSDWKRLEAMADDAIDTSKIPELGDDFFARASVRRPVDSLAVELDPEVDAWLKAHGHEHRTEINERLQSARPRAPH